MENFKKSLCPICQKKELVEIVYGMPGPDLFELEERGLVKLGGCCLPLDFEKNVTHYYCNNCQKEINIKNLENN